MSYAAEATGRPLFYLTAFDASAQDVAENANATLTVCEMQLYGACDADPQARTLRPALLHPAQAWASLTGLSCATGPHMRQGFAFWPATACAGGSGRRGGAHYVQQAPGDARLASFSQVWPV